MEMISAAPGTCEYRHDDCPPRSGTPWSDLVEQGPSPLSVYQSPAHQHFLNRKAGQRPSPLIVVAQGADSASAGVVPVASEKIRVDLSIGLRRLSTVRLDGMAVLGGEPMLPRKDAA